MTLHKKAGPQNRLPQTSIEINGQHTTTEEELPKGNSMIDARIAELESLPHRKAALHWVAFSFALLSLILLATWVFSSRGPVQGAWVWLDIGLAVFFAVEFFTRSGFRWDPAKYLRSRFFDFVAIVPALALVHHGFAIEGVWVWLILVARFVRVVDRFLGDGFILRTVLTLVEGFQQPHSPIPHILPVYVPHDHILFTCFPNTFI